jgi:CheY-like chemotaxis protein
LLAHGGIVLEAGGVEVFEAQDGEHAVATALEHPFDLILMDLRMPGMNGGDAAKALRSRRGPNRNAPIVAFTAGGDSPGNPELTSQGFDGVVRKPIVAGDLLTVVNRFTRPAGDEWVA